MKTQRQILERVKELMTTQAVHIKKGRLDEASNLGGIIYGMCWCVQDNKAIRRIQKAVWKKTGISK